MGSLVQRWAWALAAPLLLCACSGYREVLFKGVPDMQLVRLDAQGLQARVTVRLENPNPYRIRVMDPDVYLFLNGVAIGKATMDSSLVLAGRSDRDHAVTLRASFGGRSAEAMGAMLGAVLSGRATLRAKGTITGRAFLLRRRFPFEEERSVTFGN